MKHELEQLWKARATLFWKDAMRYLRIILTGYLYVPIILLIALAFFYHYLLTEWNETRYASWIFALIFSATISGGRVRTFIHESDSIYLLPAEKQMESRYFYLSWLYSSFMQAIYVFLFMLILSPLYYGMIADDRSAFYSVCGILALLAPINLYASFQEQRFREQRRRNLHRLIRWAINFLFLATLFDAYSFPIFVWLFWYVATLVYYARLSKRKSWPWSHLVEIEQGQLLRFYRFAGWFMDVPHTRVRVKKRSWFIYAVEKLSFFQTSPYYFLYVRSFARYQDIYYLYIRLLLIAAISLSFVDRFSLSIFLFGLFLIANAVQLTGSWKRFRAYFWDAIYPVSFADKLLAFQRVVYLFLLIQVMVGSIALSFRQGWGAALAVGIIGAIGAYAYSRFILNKQLKI